MPRFPVDDVRVTPHGKFGAVRRSSADGSCGTVPYPCEHPGVDLAGAKGTPVYAPEAGVIVEVGRGDKKPWTGYDPGLLRLAGRSGTTHLLAHLDPEVITRWGEAGIFGGEPKMYPLVRPVAEGDLVGYIGIDHTHWETRVGGRPGKRTNPVAWWLNENPDIPAETRQRYADLMAASLNDPKSSGGGDGLFFLLLLLWGSK